jgi:hypothetical protein
MIGRLLLCSGSRTSAARLGRYPSKECSSQKAIHNVGVGKNRLIRLSSSKLSMVGFCRKAGHGVGVGTAHALQTGEIQDLGCSLMTGGERWLALMAGPGGGPGVGFYCHRPGHIPGAGTVHAVWPGDRNDLDCIPVLQPGSKQTPDCSCRNGSLLLRSGLELWMDSFCHKAGHVVGVGTVPAVQTGDRLDLDCSLMTGLRWLPLMAGRGGGPWVAFFCHRSGHSPGAGTVRDVWPG